MTLQSHVKVPGSLAKTCLLAPLQTAIPELGPRKKMAPSFFGSKVSGKMVSESEGKANHLPIAASTETLFPKLRPDPRREPVPGTKPRSCLCPLSREVCQDPPESPSSTHNPPLHATLCTSQSPLPDALASQFKGNPTHPSNTCLNIAFLKLSLARPAVNEPGFL